MKKFGLFALLACGGMLFAGCKDKEKDKAPEANPEDTVLTDATYESYNVFGNNKVVVGEEEVDNDWNVTEHNGMTAISLTQAKAISQDLYNTLKTKSIKGLYKFEGLVLGTKDANWSENYMKDGLKKKHNGSFAFKACGCDKNEDDNWVKTAHFPSAEVHAEGLTPSTLFVTDNMQETKVDGFDHNSNPVAYEAGVYTVVLATYKQGVGDFNIMAGLGIVKTGDKEGIVEPESLPVTAMDIAGSFTSWADNPIAMTKNGNVFEGQFTCEANAEFKVRINNGWTYSLGATALSSGAYADSDQNIVMSAAGTYLVHVELSLDAMSDFLTNKTIVSFTVTPANA